MAPTFWRKACLVFVGAFLLLPVPSQAQSQLQTFSASWSGVSGPFWQYTPYQIWDSSLGTLEEVAISTTITGSRDIASEPINIRHSFFTGWSPADFQFNDAFSIGSGSDTFSLTRAFTFSSASELGNWLTYDYLPLAHNYFESSIAAGMHSLTASTTLTYTYSAVAPIPEPETYAMLLAGLALLGFEARRRKKLQRAAA